MKFDYNPLAIAEILCLQYVSNSQMGRHHLFGQQPFWTAVLLRVQEGSILRKVGHRWRRQPKMCVYYISKIYTAISMVLNHSYFMLDKNPRRNVKLLKSTAYKILDPNGNWPLLNSTYLPESSKELAQEVNFPEYWNL